MSQLSSEEEKLPFFYPYCRLCKLCVLRETGCCQTLRKGLCPQANKIFFGARCPVPRWLLNYIPYLCSWKRKKNVKRRFKDGCHRKGEVPCLVQHRPHRHSGLDELRWLDDRGDGHFEGRRGRWKKGCRSNIVSYHFRCRCTYLLLV